MLSIDSIQLTDWKGITERMDLGKLNLLVGPNGSGKSARLAAIRFAITGGTSIGEKPGDAMAFACAGGATVGCTLTDDFSWLRGVQEDPRTHEVKSFIQITGDRRQSVKELHETVVNKCGEFGPMFDLRKFLGISPDKRRNYILELCAKASGEGDDPRIVERLFQEFGKLELGQGTVGALSDGCQNVGELREKIERKLQPDRKAALANIAEDIRKALKGDASAQIHAAITKATELRNTSKRDSDKGHLAAQQLSRRKNELVVVSTSVAELKAKLTQLREDRTGNLGQIELQRGREAAEKSLGQQVYDTAQAIGGIENALALNRRSPDRRGEIEELQRRATELRERPIDVDGAERTRDERRETLRQAALTSGKLEEAMRLTCRGVQRLSVRFDSLSRLLEEAKADPWRKAIELFDGLAAAVTGAISSKAQEFRAYLTERLRSHEPDALAHELGVVKESLERQRVQDADANAAWEHAKSHHAEVDVQHRLAETDWVDAVYAQQARNLVVSEIESEAQQLAQEEANRKADIERLNLNQAEAKSRRIRLQRDLDELRAAGGKNSVDELRTLIESLEGEITKVEGHINDKQSYQTLERECAQCSANAEHEGLAHDVCKRVVDALRAIREELMHDLVKPLIDRINRFLQVAAPGRRAYCSLESPKGKAEFDLGWIADDVRKITFDALSGGEQALYGTALAYALVMLADPPLKLLMIEAGEVDCGTSRDIIDALTEVAPDLSNVLLCHWEAFLLNAVNDGWNCHDLGRRPVAQSVAHLAMSGAK